MCNQSPKSKDKSVEIIHVVNKYAHILRSR